MVTLENQEKREVKEEGSGKQCRYSTWVKKAKLKHGAAVYILSETRAARQGGSSYPQHSPPAPSESKANL